MRTSSIIASILALGTTQITAQFLNASAPFNLIVLSDNSTINGSALTACHEGAAIEGLCLGGILSEPTDVEYETYTFNISSYPVDVEPSIGFPGYLVWELEGGNFNLSTPVTLEFNPTSNIALPMFTPSEYGTSLAFDVNDLLNVQGSDGYLPTIGTTVAYYRWYICETDGGYLYTTLAWVVGAGEPENPTCSKVDVKRVFI